MRENLEGSLELVGVWHGVARIDILGMVILFRLLYGLAKGGDQGASVSSANSLP